MTTASRRIPKSLTYALLVAIAALTAMLLSQRLRGDRTLPTLSPPQAGGITTVNNRSSKAFGLPAPGLSSAEMELHAAGDVAFDAVFVTAPAPINPGLGPVFNNRSCAACHIGNGRGLPKLGNALVRMSLPVGRGIAIDPTQGVAPVPQLGAQIRDDSVYGQLPDAVVQLTWVEQSGQYGDGTGYELRRPELAIAPTDPNRPIPADLETSLRIPPPVFGTGLLEAIPAASLGQWADPQDVDGDGISGRINRVWDPEAQAIAVGRFGLKANSPNLRHQTASAYANDMGISNPLFPEADGSMDIGEQTLQENTFYSQSLGVPARSQLENPQVQRGVQRGEQLFAAANCAACHLTTVKTGPSKIQALAHQTIHPYSDLLLHDMGPALADNRPDFEADGQEWRTAPLWGLGLTQTVLPYAGYLHDGRARTVAEAIVWHGGEAEAAKDAFMAMAAGDREALLSFLNSL